MVFGLDNTGDLWRVVAILLVATFIVSKLVTYNRLRKFPGPPSTGFSNFLHSRALLGPEAHIWYKTVTDKYGQIARIGPNLLITSSPQVWMHVNAKKHYKRSDWYYKTLRFEYKRDNVFTQTDNEKHDIRRKQMAPGYSGRENPNLEPDIDDRVRELLSLIQTKYISSPSPSSIKTVVTPLNLSQKLQFFTLDVISSIGLGKPFGMLQRDEDVSRYIESTSQGLRATNAAMALGFGQLGQTPLIGPALIAPYPDEKGNGFSKMLAECFRVVDARQKEFFEEMEGAVMEEKGGGDERRGQNDMLASFMRHGLEGADLRSEAAEQILAGSDTTAGALRAAVLLISSDARVLGKLRAEIDGICATRGWCRLGGGMEEKEIIVPYDVEAKNKLPYLRAVIREVLRLHPPVVNPFPRDVPPEGDEVEVEMEGGKEKVWLPGGVSVTYCAHGMHREKRVYGEDVDVFRPERWLEDSDGERMKEMLRTNELVFGYGRWQCLGKNVAQIEIFKIIFELFRRFDIATINPAKPWHIRNVVGLFEISDMWVKVYERE